MAEMLDGKIKHLVLLEIPEMTEDHEMTIEMIEVRDHPLEENLAETILDLSHVMINF